MSNVEFDLQPESVAHAQKMRREIVDEIERIQVQLGNPHIVDSVGDRLSDEKYWEWRNSAVAAQAFKRQEAGYLRDWIKAQRTEKQEARRASDISEGRTVPQYAKRIAEALEQIADKLDTAT